MIQNMTCQFAWSMMMPATVGPAAGANAMTMPNTPMAVPRRSMGNVHMSTVITSGMRMPAPAAWIKRPASNTGKFGPQAASAVPAVNRTMDARNSRRVVKRSVRNAVMGTMMALTSVNPVVNHCATAASTHISLMIDGSAGATTVWFSTVTKVPNTSTISMTICLRVSPQSAIAAPFRARPVPVRARGSADERTGLRRLSGSLNALRCRIRIEKASEENNVPEARGLNGDVEDDAVVLSAIITRGSLPGASCWRQTTQSLRACQILLTNAGGI